jgi:hypothetical protein
VRSFWARTFLDVFVRLLLLVLLVVLLLPLFLL